MTGENRVQKEKDLEETSKVRSGLLRVCLVEVRNDL